jgi:SNF2 family DNA or RNA helicase
MQTNQTSVVQSQPIVYPMSEQPEGFKIPLMNHQRTTIYNMENLEQKMEIITSTYILQTNIGIFSDEAGYGKSLSMLGLIERNKFQLTPNTRLPSYNNTITTPKMIMDNSNCVMEDRTLMVCPLSIISQWQTEIKKTKLKCTVYKSNKDISDNILDGDIVLVSPTMYNSFCRQYSNRIWKRFVFDEPDSVSIPHMETPKYGFMWLMSSTFLARYNSVFNKVKRPHLIANLLCYRCGYFKDLVIQNPVEYIQQSINVPQPIEVFHRVKQSIVIRAVRNHVSSFVRDMLNAGDIQGALEYLGGKCTDNIIDVITLKLKNNIKSVEQDILQCDRNIESNYMIEYYKQKRTGYCNRLESLKKDLCNLDDKCKSITTAPCPICCCDSCEEPVLAPCCQNIYCGKCILSWLRIKQSCPTCRAELSANKLVFINSSKKEENKEEKKEEKKETIMCKQDKLYDMVMKGKSEKRRWIIFTNYENLFRQISTVLENFKCIEMKGAISTRTKYLKQFKNGEIDILVLNSQYNGAGINMQSATDVVLYNTFNSDMEYQCIHRAQRIGRESSVNIHRFQEVVE